MIPRKVPILPEALVLLQKLLLGLGDFPNMQDTNELYDNIDALVGALKESEDMDTYQEELSDYFIKCFQQLSMQIPIYAALLSKLYQDKRSFVVLVIDKLQKAFLVSIETNEYVVSKLLLRALVCMSNYGLIVNLPQVLQIIMNILEGEISLYESQSKSEASAQSMVLITLLGQVIVWGIPSLTQSVEGSAMVIAVRSMLQRYQIYWKNPFNLNQRQSVLHTLPIDVQDMLAEDIPIAVSLVSSTNTPASTAIGSDSIEQMIFMMLSVIQWAEESNGQWKDYPCLFFPTFLTQTMISLDKEECFSFSTDFLTQFQTILFTKINELPLINGQIGDGYLYNKKTNVLNNYITLLTVDLLPELELLHSQVSSLLRFQMYDHIHDILLFFDPIINDDGTHFGSMDMLIQHIQALLRFVRASLVVNPTISENEEEPVTSTVSIPLEYILIEYLFQQYLQQPMPTHHIHFITRILLSLCKNEGLVYPPIIAYLWNVVYGMLASFDLFTIRCLGDAFVTYFTNTQYKWPYFDHWVQESGLQLNHKEETNGNTEETTGYNDLDLETISFSQYFLRYIVEKTSRLVGEEQIMPYLPPLLHQFLIPMNKFKTFYYESSDYGDAFNKLLFMIEDRKSSDDILDYLEVLEGPGTDLEIPTIFVELFLEVILFYANQSETLSVAIALFEMYHYVFLTIAQMDEQQLMMLKKLAYMAGHKPYLSMLLLDEMIRRNLISVAVVTMFLTSDGSKPPMKIPATLTLYELVIDRTLDFARGAVSYRLTLDDGMAALDDTLDLTPAPQPEPVVEVEPEAVPTESVDEVVAEENGVNEAMNEESDAPILGKRRQRDEEEVDDENNNNMNTENDNEDDHRRARRKTSLEAEINTTHQKQEVSKQVLWGADEAIKNAIRNSRTVYRTILGNILQELQVLATKDTPEILFQKTSLYSLLNRLFRQYYGTEVILTQLVNGTTVYLSDKSVRDMTIEQLRLLNEPLLSAWSTYLYK